MLQRFPRLQSITDIVQTPTQSIRKRFFSESTQGTGQRQFGLCSGRNLLRNCRSFGGRQPPCHVRRDAQVGGPQSMLEQLRPDVVRSGAIDFAVQRLALEIDCGIAKSWHGSTVNQNPGFN